MNKNLSDMLDRIRKQEAWPEDDLMIVIHIKQKDREKIEKLMQEMGLKDNDGVEVVPT